MLFYFSHFCLVFERSKGFHQLPQGKLITLLPAPLRTIIYWLDFIYYQGNPEPVIYSSNQKAPWHPASLFAVQITWFYYLKTELFFALPLNPFFSLLLFSLLLLATCSLSLASLSKAKYLLLVLRSVLL